MGVEQGITWKWWLRGWVTIPWWRMKLICRLPELSVFTPRIPLLLSDAPTLSSGHCCEPSSPTCGAILVVFGGDPFVDIVCKPKYDCSQKNQFNWLFLMKQSIVENIEGSSGLRQNEGL
jgi:hypothetical protein